MKKFIKKYLAKPEIFCILASIYFLFGILAISDPHLKLINPNLSLHPVTAAVWFFGLFCFLLGLKYWKLLVKIKSLLIFLMFIMCAVSFHYMFDLPWSISLVVNFLTILGFSIFLDLKKYFIPLFVTGAFLLLLNFFLFGIPIIHPLLRYGVTSTFFFFVIGFYLMLLSLIRIHRTNIKLCRILFIFLVFLTILSTFRTFLSIAVLTWLFLELTSSKRNENFLPLSIILGFTVVTFIFMGYFIATTKGNWELDPLRTLEYRIGFTLHIFNGLVEKSFPFGYSFGKAFLLNEPGKFVCNLYNCRTRFTSTIIGEVMLDFGLLGVFGIMFTIGAILQSLYKKDYALFSLSLSHVITAIEVGVNIFLLLLLVYTWYWRFQKWKLKKRG